VIFLVGVLGPFQCFDTVGWMTGRACKKTCTNYAKGFLSRDMAKGEVTPENKAKTKTVLFMTVVLWYAVIFVCRCYV